LQLAEQLDRSEVGVIKALDIEVKADAVYIKAVADSYPELDIQSAMRFADRFTKYYGYGINIYY
jgi:exopolyphosphatase/guanosine-5'-triphosphate,3'-diphosphate pyrophosphatase